MKFGEPMRRCPAMSMPMTPPATIGSFGTPGTTGPAWPNGSCWPSEMPRAHDTRASFTSEAPNTLVHPATVLCDLRKLRPQADVDVPSTTPPKKPGTKRVRSAKM